MNLDRFSQGLPDMQDQVPQPEEDDYIGWDERWRDD
jgi:hypothetical protein